jgi:hypothetical protein
MQTFNKNDHIDMITKEGTKPAVLLGVLSLFLI